MSNNHEEEYVSSPTATVTTTSGQAIKKVFGENSELIFLVEERDKKKRYCKFCKKWFSLWLKKCPICNKDFD